MKSLSVNIGITSIDKNFCSASLFREGLAVVSIEEGNNTYYGYIDRKGDFCYLGRAGIWVFCSVPLRTGHMGGLLYFCFDLRIFVQEGIEIEA